MPTARFHQIVRTYDTTFKPCDSESDNEYSFYSEDSYEGIESRLEYRASTARLKKIRKLVPRLDLASLPAYVSSDDEEGEQQQQ